MSILAQLACLFFLGGVSRIFRILLSFVLKLAVVGAGLFAFWIWATHR